MLSFICVYTVYHITIMLQMEILETLGYAAFAFGFREDNVQFASTSSAKCCSRGDIVHYLHATILAGE